MRVTITGGGLQLARGLASRLSDSCDVRLVAPRPVADLPAGVEMLAGDLREPEFAAQALVGTTVLVHLAPLEFEGYELEVIDGATRGTYVVMRAAREAGVQRVVLGSTLELFHQLPAGYRVSETWRPDPLPAPTQLPPWLAELSVREFARLTGFPPAICLRLGGLEESRLEPGASRRRRRAEPPPPASPDWLHPDDAVAALRRAIEFDVPGPGWHLYHVTAALHRQGAAARPPFDFTPQHEADGPESSPTHPYSHHPLSRVPATHPIPSRPIRRVVIYGAGGPLAAVTARALAPNYVLRLADIRSIEAIHAAGQRQSPNAPLPEPLPPPHEMRIVDVTDLRQTVEAAEGMDAIINCTVIRPDPVEAFRVNTLGAYNIARAAVRHGIRRVVQTGPQMVALASAQGYWWDYDVPGNAPPRPADHLYGHSKYLGQEILRVFADCYDLEVPVLLFCIFVNPERDDPARGLNPFSVSWEDAAIALRRALEVEWFPSPFEVMNVLADLPHGKFSNERAKQVLGWQPRDSLQRFWSEPG
jgi:nucleoside-diphosphate-sugar epimerase